MKPLLSLAFGLILGGVASAAPYVVYTGTAKTGIIATQGTGTFAGTVHLITDLADSNNYAMVEIDSTKKFYLVLGRPATSPPANAGFHNFITGIVNANGKTGIASLAFTSIQADDYVSHVYATGPLFIKPVTLAAARTAPLKMWITAAGNPYASFTFPTSAAVTTTGMVMPASFKGTVTGSGEPVGMSMNGSIVMTYDKVLTPLANIGGPFTVGKNIYAVMPLTFPNGSSTTLAFGTWLSDIAEIAGAKNTGAGANAQVILPIATSEDPSNLAFGGTLSGIPSITLPSGTLSLVPKSGVTPPSYTTPVINAAQYGAGFSGILSVGAPAASFYTGSTNSATLTRLDAGNPGATLTGFFNLLDFAVSGLVIGTTTADSSSAGSFGSGNLLGSQVVWLKSATLNVTAVNDGQVNGTFTLPAGVSSIASSFSVTTANLNAFSSNHVSPNVPLSFLLQPGDSVTGTFVMGGGTLNDNATVFTDTNSSIFF